MGASAIGSWRSHDGGRPAGSSRRSAELPAELLAQAHRYARDTLLLPPGPATDGLVAAALVRAGRRGRSRQQVAVADEQLHDAIRHEAWRRQRHPDRVRKAHLRARRRFEESPTRPVLRSGRLMLTAVAVTALIIAASLTVRAARADGDSSGTASVTSSAPGVVRGTVIVDGDGSDTSGLDDVRVQLTDGDGSTVASARTDRLGQFTFQEVAPATYVIRVSPPPGLSQVGGSGPGSVAADVRVEPGADIPLTIVLEPA